MKQFSPADSATLSFENPNSPQQIAVLAVLDPSEAPRFGFDALFEAVAERIQQVPVYTSKVREVPFGLDHAYLVEDENFDPRNHIFRSVVSSPGGLRELTELAGRLFAPQLDRNKPLWEMWYIEGLADGKIGLLIKTHHCLMDGIALSGLAKIILDVEPNPAADSTPAARPVLDDETDGEISDLDVLVRAARNSARRPFEFARLAARTLLSRIESPSSPAPFDEEPAPETPPFASFNGQAGWQRSLVHASLALPEIKTIKKRFNVTVNDVLLAVTSGAVRHYLSTRGDLPERELVAAIPISLRVVDTSTLTTDNQFTVAPVAWGTHIGDPGARLRHIHKSAVVGKRRVRASGENAIAMAGTILSPGVLHMLMRYVAPHTGEYTHMFNLSVSTLQATPFPLYVAGARLEEIYPMTVLYPGQGLAITAVTYVDRVYVGFTFAPELVPQPWLLSEGIEKSLSDLSSASPPSQSTRT